MSGKSLPVDPRMHQATAGSSSDRAAYAEGGYEIEATPFAPEAGERLCHETLALLEKLAKERIA